VIVTTAAGDVADGLPAAGDLTAGLAAAAALLRAAGDVTLLAHVYPDADALGSALALGLALHRSGAAVRVSFGEPERAPESLVALDVAGLLVPATEVPAAPPLLVALDTGSVQRLGSLGDRVRTAQAVLVIDHHVTNTRFGTHNLVDASAEATAVLVLRLLDELGVPLDVDIARCLYAGLVTDTRCFRLANPATHGYAARLLAAGVRAEHETRSLMDTHPFGWLGMLANVLGRAELEPAAARGLGLVHTSVLAADTNGMRTEEIESIIDLVRTSAEAEVAAVLKEVGEDRWSVSLRAKQRVDVGAAAAALGGGGHRLASGFTTTGRREDVLVALRLALDAALMIRPDPV
jgi:bifunctional oligoribonuclease and PAP phosphatase NrnA